MTLAFLLLILATLATPAQAQVQYAVKFVCGIAGVEARREAVKPGNYATAINIHNPNPFPVDFSKKAAQAQPQGFDRRPPSTPVPEGLDPDFALEVDCQNIRQLLGGPPSPTFVKGFLVILSPNELDVVAVYTSEPPPDAAGVIHGMGLEVLPVAPRFMPSGPSQSAGAKDASKTKQ